MKYERNYLESIYDIIDSEDIVDDNGITIIDEDDDYDYNSLYEPEWGEEVDFLDGDESEDECYLEELGDGFIPLPQGDVEVNVVVIDEDYVPDEYEIDVCGGCSQEEIEVLDELEKDDSEVINVGSEMSDYKNKGESNFDDELARLHNATVEDSVINTPETKSLSESMNVIDDDPDTDKIAKSIAREHMDRMSEQTLLPGDETANDIDKEWIREDMFGNDIGSIIADVPNIDSEDDDYVDGSFMDWANEHGVAL